MNTTDADLSRRRGGAGTAACADQNERDYETFTAAVNSGRLIARTGV
jgi:hypothetical protein